MQRTILLGTTIDDVSLDQAEERCLNFLHTKRTNIVVTPNPEMLVFGFKNKWFRRIFEHSELSIPDGVGLKLGALLLNKKIEHTTPGVDLTKRLLKRAEERGFSVLFLGGREGIATKLISNLRKEFPKLQVSYLNGGAINDKGAPQDESIIDDVNALSPDMIFVCFGHPKQEQFMQNYKDEIDTKVMLGVGGTIDFFAGTKKRSPRWIHRLWIEWLYRLIQEPSRVGRIITAIFIFPILCLRWRYRSTRVYRKNVAGLLMDKGDILVGQHALTGYWQIPQGGMKQGESYKEAIYREMSDETGTGKYKIEDMVKDCYSYEWNQHDRDIHGFRGQNQTVVILQFTGNRDEIHMSPHEFTAHEWVSKEKILGDPRIPDFKKTIIKIGLEILNK